MIIPLDTNIIGNLTKTEREIINYINGHEGTLAGMSIVDIAFETFSSPSTVSRAIRKCGLNGFNELRYRSGHKAKSEEIQNINELFNKTLIEAQAVHERISLTDILKVIECMKDAHQISVFARGLTTYVGQEFSLKLQLLGYDVFFSDDPNIMRVKASKMKEKDILFILSLNGQTPELILAAATASQKGNCVISCCCNPQSQLISYSNIALVGYKHAHQAIKEFEVSSRIALYMICRIIIDYISESV
ncbi:MurR/RpiR family transcriptional regulator [Lacrimispora sp. AGF001]|uniref:MurR/RpiR family transcriptional regulator n=1 Tax=Lacrimispora sp. AGF001 TaxID=3401631 RepID=UPI003B43B0F1|nr:MurR/RpiR family transcriptional regulator [Paenibacillaceae bacterium]